MFVGNKQTKLYFVMNLPSHEATAALTLCIYNLVSPTTNFGVQHKNYLKLQYTSLYSV